MSDIPYQQLYRRRQAAIPVSGASVFMSRTAIDAFGRLVGNSERSCRVVVAFSDPRFLPVTLLVVPDECSGYRTASLRLPESLADGYASIQWYVLEASAKVIPT